MQREKESRTNDLTGVRESDRRTEGERGGKGIQREREDRERNKLKASLFGPKVEFKSQAPSLNIRSPSRIQVTSSKLHYSVPK